MKKLPIVLLLSFTLNSCATVFGGRVDDCQRTKPAPGQPSRKVRPVALIANILFFWPGVIVDLATHQIYKPCGK